MTERIDAVAIGAGFCGLGVGASLRARGVASFAILEQGDAVGHFWSRTYDRLHLHSAFHDMPADGGLRREYPVFIARNQLLEYFSRYAALHELAPHLRFGTRVERIRRIEPSENDGFEWRLETTRGVLDARTLAIATAVNRVPKIPHVPEREKFLGRVLHSGEYRNPSAFVGRNVLVVGSGNSAAEISLDLVEGSAKSVAMWVRAPRHFIPIRRMELLFRVLNLFGALSGARADATHRISDGTPAFERTMAARDKLTSLLTVDLTQYGIRKPTHGPMTELYRSGRIPTFDQGAIPKIRSGAIRVIDGNARPIERFCENGIAFGDGEERFDDVVFATGFEPRLEQFLDVPALLGPSKLAKLAPITDGRSRSRIHPSAFFPGFDRTPLGGQSLGRWGWEVGERIAELLG